jgi:Exopolysaccharide biosynthesis protein
MTFQWDVKDKCLSVMERAKLRNRNFSIISSNCLAGSIYHKYGLQYSSPTIGTFFYSDEYLKMLENFKYYMAQPLLLKETSVHPEVNELMAKTYKFPVGVLGGDVEIMFLHYTSKEEAHAKWVRRVRRINFDNLFVIFTDAGAAGGGAGSDDFKEEYVERFEALPFKNKVLLSKIPMRGNHVVHIRDSDPRYPWVENMVCNRKFEKYMDMTAWLNGDKEYKKLTGVQEQVRRSEQPFLAITRQ